MSSRPLKNPRLRWARAFGPMPAFRKIATTIAFGLAFGWLARAEDSVPRFTDPTRPALPTRSSQAPVSAEEPKWMLSSVLISPGRRIAIINGISVRQGDRVNGASVLSITRDAVTLDGPLGRLALRLHSGAVKRDTEVPDE